MERAQHPLVSSTVRRVVVCGRSFVPLYWVYTAIPGPRRKIYQPRPGHCEIVHSEKRKPRFRFRFRFRFLRANQHASTSPSKLGNSLHFGFLFFLYKFRRFFFKWISLRNRWVWESKKKRKEKGGKGKGKQESWLVTSWIFWYLDLRIWFWNKGWKEKKEEVLFSGRYS